MRAAALLAAVLLAGCELMPPPLPELVVNRDPLPSCGHEVLAQDEAGDLEIRTCLFEAYLDGRAAEMISTQATAEGWSTTRFIRVHENGAIIIYEDGRPDPRGEGRWDRLRCVGLIPVEQADLDHPDEMVFLEDRCDLAPSN